MFIWQYGKSKQQQNQQKNQLNHPRPTSHTTFRLVLGKKENDDD